MTERAQAICDIRAELKRPEVRSAFVGLNQAVRSRGADDVVETFKLKAYPNTELPPKVAELLRRLGSSDHALRFMAGLEACALEPSSGSKSVDVEHSKSVRRGLAAMLCVLELARWWSSAQGVSYRHAFIDRRA